MTYSKGIDISNLACAPIPKVRIGFVGLGYRGMANIRRYFIIPDIEIVAVCDINPEAVGNAVTEIENSLGYKPWQYNATELLLKDASRILDLIIVSTDWASHATIACAVMNAGVHVAVEVPLAPTIAECNRVVATAERTRKHCILLENCCYDPFALRTLELVKSGKIGEVTHCEGAYIHCLKDRYAGNRWFEKEWMSHKGNPYPTHAIGPICQLMDINRNDTLSTLVAMTGHDSDGIPTVNTTLITTTRGRTIMLQHDIMTPRPYSRIQTVCATRGYVSKYPLPTVTATEAGTLTGTDAERFLDNYRGEIENSYSSDGIRLGVENMMNYYMDRRLIDLLRNGAPMDISVYDAALWSAVAELSAESSCHGGKPVAVPSFR